MGAACCLANHTRDTSVQWRTTDTHRLRLNPSRHIWKVFDKEDWQNASADVIQEMTDIIPGKKKKNKKRLLDNIDFLLGNLILK